MLDDEFEEALQSAGGPFFQLCRTLFEENKKLSKQVESLTQRNRELEHNARKRSIDVSKSQSPSRTLSTILSTQSPDRNSTQGDFRVPPPPKMRKLEYEASNKDELMWMPQTQISSPILVADDEDDNDNNHNDDIYTSATCLSPDESAVRQKSMELIPLRLEPVTEVSDSESEDENLTFSYLEHRSPILKATPSRAPSQGQLWTPKTAIKAKQEPREGENLSDFSINPLANRFWILEDFKPNPVINFNIPYAFKASKVGKNSASEKCRCKKCLEIDSLVGNVPMPQAGPVWGKPKNALGAKPVQQINNVVHHEMNEIWGRPDSPPGFSRSDFPTTQERVEDRAKSEYITRQKTLERLYHAIQVETRGGETGQTGKYIFRADFLNEVAKRGDYFLNHNLFK